jgi:hypothetical protein
MGPTGDGRESVGVLYQCDRYNVVRTRLLLKGARPLSAGQPIVVAGARRMGTARKRLHSRLHLTKLPADCQAADAK